VLALLYGLAIFAPLLANDRPYMLEAIDYKGYESARKRIWFSALGLVELVGKTPEEYLAGRMGGSEQGYAEALGAEAGALAGAIGTMRLYLGDADLALLSSYQQEVERLVRFGIEERRQEAARLAVEVRTRAKDVRDALRPRSPEGGEGVRLRPHQSYPLFEALHPLEIFFMVLWAGALGFRLWRRGGGRRWAWLLGLCLLAATGSAFLRSGREATYYPEYKAGLSSGKIEAVRAIFPPLVFGFAELGTEVLRPPTWHGSAEIDGEGRYVRGSRGPSVASSEEAVPASVEVRFGEPERNSPWRHPMGTDPLGRDLFVRALYGGRVSLAVGLVSTLVLVLIGVLVGASAGYFGGKVDLLISRVIEVVICFPAFFLILGVVVFVGQGLFTIMLVIGLFRWTGIARLTRAEFLRLRELAFVDAARALGLPATRIVLRHLLPNALGPILVAATFSLGAGLLIESGLSFLGFGVSEPVPSWGALVRASANPAHWWIQVFPGALIFLTVLCYNLVGDGVRDALDPRLDEVRAWPAPGAPPR